jgi:hypothetical protein
LILGYDIVVKGDYGARTKWCNEVLDDLFEKVVVETSCKSQEITFVISLHAFQDGNFLQAPYYETRKRD